MLPQMLGGVSRPLGAPRPPKSAISGRLKKQVFKTQVCSKVNVDPRFGTQIDHPRGRNQGFDLNSSTPPQGRGKGFDLIVPYDLAADARSNKVSRSVKPGTGLAPAFD